MAGLRMTEEEYKALMTRRGNDSVNAAKKVSKKRGPSKGEVLFANQLELSGITGWLKEYKFHPERKWRFDFADPGRKIAVEIEGVTTYGDHLGRHQTKAGMTDDCEKYNTATAMGWRVFRFTPGMVGDETAIALILSLAP